MVLEHLLRARCCLGKLTHPTRACSARKVTYLECQGEASAAWLQSPVPVRSSGCVRKMVLPPAALMGTVPGACLKRGPQGMLPAR